MLDLNIGSILHGLTGIGFPHDIARYAESMSVCVQAVNDRFRMIHVDEIRSKNNVNARCTAAAVSEVFRGNFTFVHDSIFHTMKLCLCASGNLLKVRRGHLCFSDEKCYWELSEKLPRIPYYFFKYFGIFPSSTKSCKNPIRVDKGLGVENSLIECMENSECKFIRIFEAYTQFCNSYSEGDNALAFVAIKNFDISKGNTRTDLNWSVLNARSIYSPKIPSFFLKDNKRAFNPSIFYFADKLFAYFRISNETRCKGFEVYDKIVCFLGKRKLSMQPNQCTIILIPCRLLVIR